jgi:hypothetical protein
MSTPEPVYSSPLEDGLRYVEELPSRVGPLEAYMELFWRRHPAPALRCSLWSDDGEGPLSYVWIMEYTARVGAAPVAAIGFAAAATRPELRRRGLFTCLMHVAMKRAAQRAPIAFLRGISNAYRRLGYVACMAEQGFTVASDVLRCVEPNAPHIIRGWSEADCTPACALYNRSHAVRSCTVLRQPRHLPGLRATSAWEPGDEVLVCERDTTLQGYALMAALPYGQDWRGFEVREIVAADADAARALLVAVGIRAEREGRAQLTIDEPPDSAVGAVLRSLDCSHTARYVSDGGWMAAVLDREALIGSARAELARRFSNCANEIEALLRTGALLPCDRLLVQLLLGSRSWHDLEYTAMPDELGLAWQHFTQSYAESCERELPVPFIHAADRF